MIVCPGCGQENPSGFRICGMCGISLAVEPQREQRKTVTVVFCDVTGSTALGERLDPESLRRVMARYFEEMSGAIERHGGTVEKFIGDAVMAVFGIPVTREDDALRAVRAAAEMRERLAALNEELSRDYGTTIASRIGVNTGEVVTGTQERLATGDAVNVAARLEQAAEPDEILLGEATFALVRGAATAETVGPLALKGKQEGVRAHRLLSVAGETPLRRLDSPLVGRAREQGLLAGAWDRVVSERTCHLFTLLGTAGVGKSRLVAEFLDGLDETVLRGRCLSYGEGITYWPVVEVVKQLLGLDGSDRLSQLMHDAEAETAIAALLGESSQPMSSEQITWATRKLLEAAALESPLVVVFDDIHWGEPTFLDLVDTMADLSRGAPILLLCMARPELLDLRPGWAGGKLGATTVLLEPLSAAETELLLDNLLSSAPLEDDVRERIRATAEGNPLFIEETAAMLREHGPGDGRIPPTIHALLAARLDLLDPAERRVLERGAVEGQTFHRGAVQALVPEEPDVSGRLVRLVRKDLVRPDRTVLPGEDAYRFRHLLIRDAAYDALAKSTRATLHERFAEWLDAREQTLVEQDEVVGYHLEQAFRYRSELGPVDAVATALASAGAGRLAAAGRRALELGDVTGAVNLLERAVSLSESEEIDPALELVLARALTDAGRPAEAVERVGYAIARAEAIGDRTLELHARLQRQFYFTHLDPQGRGAELTEVIELARPELEASGDDAALAALWSAIGQRHIGECRFVGAVEAYTRAAGHARRSGDRQLAESMLTWAATGVAWGPTPVEDGIAWLETHGAAATSVWFDAERATLLAALGRFDEARALHAAVLENARERGMVRTVANLAQNKWALERLAGDPAAAERAVREGYEALRALGNAALASTDATMLAHSLCDLGRHDEAEHHAVAGAELGGPDDVLTLVLADSALARVAAHRGDHERAARLANAAVARAEDVEAPDTLGVALLDLAEVLARAGRSADAAVAAGRAVIVYDGKGNLVAASRARERLVEYET